MFDVTETLERLQNDRQFLATVLATMFFLAIFPAYFAMAGSNGNGSLSAVADYKIEGELEYIELENATEYINSGPDNALEIQLTSEAIQDANSKNIVGIEIVMSYEEDEETTGVGCVIAGGGDAPDTISATISHDSYNGSGDGQNSGGNGGHTVEAIWFNSSMVGATVSGLSKSQIMDQLDSNGAGEGEYFVEIIVTAETGNAGPGCNREDSGENVSYSIRLIIFDYSITTDIASESGNV